MRTSLTPASRLVDARPGAARHSRGSGLALLRLRLRAWWLSRRPGAVHPLAARIARGDWASLDRLIDELADEPAPRGRRS